MITLEEIIKSAKLTPSGEGRKLIARAYSFAQKAHEGQKRKSGEPYFIHCAHTAKILALIGMDPGTIAAGLLHDTAEDTPITLEDIQAEFGEEIAWMVDGVTKLGHIRLKGSQEEYFIENLRKMFLAMGADIRVVIVKLADRLHNMRTLHHVPAEKQERIARETMEVYAPIANRLGISEIKSELEDLAFRYLEPEAYVRVKKLYTREQKEYKKYVTRAIDDITVHLKKNGVKTNSIKGRAKNIYSLYMKLKRYDFDIARIYDIVAIRIIVEEISDCYAALGIVHKRYRPMVGRIKDYVSLPKPNGYQSIHTTVFGPEGRIIEVQIRTQQMHNEAEFGIAAHWLYKEKTNTGWRSYIFRNRQKTAPVEEQRRMQWVKQLTAWQNEIGSDNSEFMESLKIDFFKNHIFAFTPKGDIIDLPEEATAIDFAYAIHTEVGNRTTGAKADGKMIPLDQQIRNGQVIEILTTKEPKTPNRNWLDFVKTSAARTHIRRQLKNAGEKVPFSAAAKSQGNEK